MAEDKLLNVKEKKALWICYILIVICAFWNNNRGIDLTDTGFSLTRFLYPFHDVSGMSTWLSNCVGYFLIHIFQLKSLFMLRMAFSVFVSFTCIFLLHMSKEHMNPYIATIGLCIAIMTSHYFPFTIAYIFLSICIAANCICALYWGLVKKNNKLLLIAGFLMGINVWVRFPNICYAVVVIAVFYWFFLVRLERKDILKIVFNIVFGGVIAIIVGILFLKSTGNLELYIQSFASLKELGMSDGSHNIITMLKYYLTGIMANLKNATLYIAFGIFGVLIWGKKSLSRYVKVVLSVILYGVLLWYTTLLRDFFSAMSIWTGLAILISFVYVLYGNSERMKLYAALSLIQFLLIPIGSDQGVAYYSSCLVFVAPLLCQGLYKGIKKLGTQLGKHKLNFLFVKIYSLVLMVFFSLVLVVYSGGRTYRDNAIYRLDTETSATKLSGIKTTKRKAELLNPVISFLENNREKFDKTITMGSIPLFSYILDKEPATSSAWVDLESYPIELFDLELEKINGDERVWIIVAKTSGRDVTWDLPENAQPSLLEKGEDEKINKMLAFVEKQNYRVLFNSEYFTVYGQ